MKKNFIVLFMMLLLFSCSSINDNIDNEKEYKLTSDYKNFVLTWGYNNSNSDCLMGYKLYDNGKIDFFQQYKETNKLITDSITTIPMSKVLKILEYTNNTYLYTPALNEPGKECKYIELVKPTVNFYSKVQWNEHNTYGSKTFRILFDTLLTLIPLNIR